MAAGGTISCSSSSRFEPTSTFSVVAPVTLLPGRLRLATRPSSTGSLLVVKTIGIVVVASFATRFSGVLVAALRPHDDEPDQRPTPVADHIGLPPSDIRSPRFDLRRSQPLSGLGEMQTGSAHTHSAMNR